MSSLLLLIDGNAIMHRAYHALPRLTTNDGIPTNVVYGFLSMLYKATQDFSPSHIAVCFDTPKPTFRNKLYEKYQIQRPEVDREMIDQIPLVKTMLDEAGIFRIERDGFEADDVIGTIVAKSHSSIGKTIILTGDKDIMQLVDNQTFVLTPQIGFGKSQLFDKHAVFEKLHVSPKQIVDYKALCGDPSDNYPGANGIGPKTASSLIGEFRTVENIYKNLDRIENLRTRNILKEYKKDVMVSQKLAQIKCDVPLKLTVEQFKFNGFNIALERYLEKLNITSLRQRIFSATVTPVKARRPKPNNPANQESLF